MRAVMRAVMRAAALLLAVAAWPALAAAEPITYPPVGGGPADAENTLMIYGGIDRGPIETVIHAFQANQPAIGVTFWEFNTNDLFDRFVDESDRGVATADVVISSAIDLQTKLVNDGYAQDYAAPAVSAVPAWAVWRSAAFGFTFEPAVIAYAKGRLPPGAVPRTRADLVRLLQDPALHGKVATYDPERSGIGLLLATQDAKQSPVIWDLAQAFGQAGVKLFTNTDAILDRIADGQLLLGYNLLGSYAVARHDPRLGIVLPADYTLVLSRVALIARAARHQANARAFIDFLLSPEGQASVGAASLFSIRRDVPGEATAERLAAQAGEALRPIPIGPGLMVYLDPIKRRNFLDRWQKSLGGQLATAP